MPVRQQGPTRRELALMIVAILAIGFVALALLGGQTSRILSNVSAPI